MIEAALEEARLRVAKIVKRIEEDDDAPRSLNARLKDWRRKKCALRRNSPPYPDPVVVRLPANYQQVYRTAIAQLQQHLRTPDAA